MAAAQRDISVSEFFAKNRHLLGFDNPRKALLTTVKEAVDNSLDACEEAGILPEIWVHIEQTGNNRYKIGVQDNGPGIVKKQIPLIFGKLLYGSKFHRLRMSRGQQGIGITRRRHVRRAHHRQAGEDHLEDLARSARALLRDSDRHQEERPGDPQRQRRRGRYSARRKRRRDDRQARHRVGWRRTTKTNELAHGTRVTIELEGRYQRGRGCVDEYLEQTAIANPHVPLHYIDPEGNERLFERSTDHLPPEPKEIKPHPYGIELGRLVTMLKDTKEGTLSPFLTR